MSTRGLYGLRKNGIDKLAYNHSDSYPSYLGAHIIDFLTNVSIEQLNFLYDHIILVNEDSTPTQNEIDFCMSNNTGYLDNTRQNDLWYGLLHNLQGDLIMIMEIAQKNNKVYLIDNQEFIRDSLFCEWAYIINLDTNKLEIYEGFQKTPDDNNRYGNTPNQDGYYPCQLLLEIPLNKISACVNMITDLVHGL